MLSSTNQGRHKTLRSGRVRILQKAAQARRTFFSTAGMQDKEPFGLLRQVAERSIPFRPLFAAFSLTERLTSRHSYLSA
jgi:hypothetical protein